MPCKERRARTMMAKGRAKPYWKDGIFCIVLQEEPFTRKYQKVVIGIDPGTKREGITVTTEQRVVMNITSNAITHIKDKIELRRIFRRSRRQRKNPYRKCRRNRKNTYKEGRVVPSIKSRWDAKLRIVKKLKEILPITDISVEDVAARTIKHSKNWNTLFSTLEYGKTYFYTNLYKMGFNICKWEGFDTYNWRTNAGYKKTSKKLKDLWDAHNVDSHCLCEMLLGHRIEPIKIMYRIIFFCPMRRNLFKKSTLKGGVRRRDGGSISLGLKKYTLVRHPKHGLSIVGGNMKGRLSLHDIHTNKRLAQNIKISDITIVSYNLKWYLKPIVCNH